MIRDRKALTIDAPERGYFRIVVLSDVHLPGNIFRKKEQALAMINSWPDVDLVAVTGDMVAGGGGRRQYASAREFFSRLNRPTAFIGGNHDYMYPDSFAIDPESGHHRKEISPEARKRKLAWFKATWGLQKIFYSRRAGDYLLVFLTPDDLATNNYSQMTDRQLQWLTAELQANRNRPTIIFFHAPLKGTFASQLVIKSRSPDSYCAEPADEIKQILMSNPQVIMWVAGHLHLAPSNSDFRSDINLYENHVVVIHNPDLDGTSIFHEADLTYSRHETIWTNSLFLYPRRVVVKTFDHQRKAWLRELERVIMPGDRQPQRMLSTI